jgi:hypothetical protein
MVDAFIGLVTMHPHPWVPLLGVLADEDVADEKTSAGEI